MKLHIDSISTAARVEPAKQPPKSTMTVAGGTRCDTAFLDPVPLVPVHLESAKAGFTTRRVRLQDARQLLRSARPSVGDVALARVTKVGRHTRLQLAHGRRSVLFEGDTIVASYGARYATDQTEAHVPADLGACHLVAAGGVMGVVQRWHDGLRRSTALQPLGLLAGADGRPLNLSQYGLPNRSAGTRIKVILVVGTGMNSGKTTAAAHLIKGLSRSGKKVAGIKVTGTGAGNDLWMYEDAGAAATLDFTDAGYPSTYQVAIPELEAIYATLTGHAERTGADFAVVEIADGLLQAETAALLNRPTIGEGYDGLVVCAADALGAQAGVEWLERRGHRVDCVSGAVTASPLASDEAACATRLPIVSRQMLSDEQKLPCVIACLAEAV